MQTTDQIILFVDRQMGRASLLLFILLPVMLVLYFARRPVADHQAQLAAYMERL